MTQPSSAPPLPPRWEVTTLGVICDLINGDRGKNYPGRKALSREGIPFVNAGDLQEGIISTERLGFIPPATFDLLRSGKFALNDILYCIRGSLGKAAFNSKFATGGIASSLIIVRPNPGLHPKYVFYYLISPLAHSMVRKFDNGTAQPNLSGADLARFEIPVPGFQIQEKAVAKIEELFSELDKGVESLTTAREQLKAYRQAVLKHAFEGKLTADWRLQRKTTCETRHSLVDRIQRARQEAYARAADSPGRDGRSARKSKPLAPISKSHPFATDFSPPSLPNGWHWAPLEWLLSATTKPMTTGPFGTMLKKHEHQQMGVPVLGIENIGRAIFVPGNKIFVTQGKAIELAAFEVRAGDIVISRSGTVGEICAVPSGLGKALISTNLMRVSLNTDVIAPAFFVYMFQGGASVKAQVKAMCKGSSREFLNQSILESIAFPLCGLEEQYQVISEIEERLSKVDALESEIEQGLERVKALRQAILQNAFSGRLVVQDPNDEPASVLLERIRAKKEQGGNGRKKNNKNNGKEEAA